jgi:hypothetical protein
MALSVSSHGQERIRTQTSFLPVLALPPTTGRQGANHSPGHEAQPGPFRAASHSRERRQLSAKLPTSLMIERSAPGVRLAFDWSEPLSSRVASEVCARPDQDWAGS